MSGCSLFKKEFVCEARCEQCEDVILTCRGTSKDGEIEE